MCGEQLVLPDRLPSDLGSSPRVRGTALRVSGAPDRTGIIPACAGNSAVCIFVSMITRDHPRVCGEQVKEGYKGTSGQGSSPRVRGTGKGFRPYAPASGIIPACAGNREFETGLPFLFRDHPRVCGEQRISMHTLVMLLGSSPRVRGTDISVPRDSSCCGIIPACAGNRIR